MSHNSKMTNSVYRLLRILKVDISEGYLERLLTSHADYPSLLSVADTLERLGLNYSASKVSIDDLPFIPFPYLLPVSSGKEPLLIIEKEQDLIKYGSLVNNYFGVVLHAAVSEAVRDESVKESYLEKRRKKTLLMCFWCILASLFAVLVATSFSVFTLLIGITSLVGAVVAYFAFAKKVGITYDIVEEFCNSGHSDCGRVLNSKGANIFGFFEFSDAALSYFIFQIFLIGVLALSSNKQSGIFILTIASLLTVPIILFSIYYQAFKVRSWCKLCLIIDVILLCQLPILLFENGLILPQLNVFTILLALLGVLIIGNVVLFIKEALVKVGRDNLELSKSLRTKNDPSVFLHLLNKQTPIDITPFDYELSVGKKDAPVKVIMVSNLFCDPCKSNHSLIAQMIDLYPQKLHVTFRFVESSRNPLAFQYILNYWIRNIYSKGDQDLRTLRILHHWYETRSLKEFSKRYPMRAEVNNTDFVTSIARAHYKWVQNIGIRQTPTFFVGGREIPKGYSIGDLFNFFPGLYMEFETTRQRENPQQLDSKFVLQVR